MGLVEEIFPKIQTIDFKLSAPEKVRIMLVQLKTDPEDWEEKDGLPFLKDYSQHSNYIDWVISEASRVTANIIIFPELSVPEKVVIPLQHWSEDSASIVIAGSHYFYSKHIGFISRCPIIVSGRIYYSEKYNPAPIEISPIGGEGLHKGQNLFFFKNTTIGNFAVLICSDYLENTLKKTILRMNPDFLFIVAYQKDSNVYHSRISIDIEEQVPGIYCIYSNMFCSGSGDGRSSVFGMMDKIYLEKLRKANLSDLDPRYKAIELKSDQECLVVECNLSDKRPYAKRTVKTKPNIKVISKSIKQDKSNVQFTQLIAHYDERYSRIDELYVPPREFDQMLSLLESNRLLFIVGDPGIGKTYTAVAFLKHYFNLGYEPIWFTGIERTDRVNQRIILENFHPKPGQAVYFEDPFGRTSFEKRDTIASVFGPLLDHLQNMDARVIVTSRKEIFEQFTMESLTSVDLNKFSEEMNIIKPSYSNEKLQMILDKLANDISWYNNIESRELVYDAIYKNQLGTPLAIRDLVFSTASIGSAEILSEHLERRGIEETQLFSIEMEACKLKTKLFLALIFLFGNQKLSTLSDWYNHVGRSLDLSSEYWSGTAPILSELRSQDGYRIEQYGFKISRYRFAHPRYEEAFCQLMERNFIVFDIVVSVLKSVARTNLMTAIKAANAKSKKYPKLAENMLKNLVLLIVTQASLFQISQIGFKLVGTTELTGYEGFFQLLEKITNLKDIALRINKETDLIAIAYTIRFLNYYCRRLARMGKIEHNWKSEFGELIDIDRISHLIDDENNFQKIAEILIRLKTLSKACYKYVNRYLSNIAHKDLLIQFYTLPVSQRIKLYECTEQDTYVRTLLKKNINQEEVKNLRQGVKKWLASNPSPEVGLVIDDGAIEAIKRGRSLLPVGVLKTTGNFDMNQAIGLLDIYENLIGVCIAAYSSNEVALIKGHHSTLIDSILGYSYGSNVALDRSIVIKENEGLDQT
jgi:predicted ribosome-associated RNA-binding protein Tma20